MTLLADWLLTGPLLTLWPFRDDVWREQGKPAQRQLLDFVRTVAARHKTLVGVHPEHVEQAKPLISAHSPFFEINYNDAWARDIGPLWVRATAGNIEAHCFKFSAWHGLYPDYTDDQQFAENLAAHLKVAVVTHDLILEGGAISTDGAGTAVVHAASVLRNNPTWSRRQIADYLKQHLHLQQIYWLEFSHPADETGGHADNYLQFLDAGTLAVSLPAEASEFYAIYKAQLQQVKGWHNSEGQRYRVLVLPQPEPVHPRAEDFASVRVVPGVFQRGNRDLLASYVNFVRLGNLLIVPIFGLQSDATVLSTLRQALPQLQVFAAPAAEFIKAGGALHCMTLPLPSQCLESL